MQKTALTTKALCGGGLFEHRLAWIRPRLLTETLLVMRHPFRGIHTTGRKSFMLAMKLTIVLLTAAFLQVHASAVSQSVTLSGKNISLKKVFAAIEKQTGYVVFSNKEDLEATKPVTLSVYDMPLENLLRIILRDQPVNYRFDGTTIVLSRKPAIRLPDVALDSTHFELIPPQPVSGRVTDSLLKPIEGASVKILPGNKGGTTTANGSFTILNINPGTYTLQISFVGYEVVTRRITVTENEPLQLGTIVLKASVTDLSGVEILSTGYQNLPRERSTGSFSTVSEQLLRARVETNLLNRLEGLIPGLYMANGAINIRGLATLYGNQSPLFVVDGFPYEGDINYINPDDVINVTVMKDAAAASIYGTRAANGVISITTRLGSARQTRINFNSTMYISPIPDASYLQLMNSREMVDLQVELFNQRHPDLSDNILRSAQPKAIEALYKFEQGQISQAELDATLNRLRTLDGQSQLEDMLMQNSINHRHSFSVSGGNNINQYSVTMNYTGSRGHTIRSGSDIVNVGLNDRAQVFKWLTADIGMLANFSKNKTTPVSATSFYRNMPYEIIKDENGNNVPWNYRKSQYEIDRLIGLGLLDESFNPLNELDRSDIRSNSQYVRLQGGFNVKIAQGLNLDIKYQTERGSNYYKTFNGRDAHVTANMINNATTIRNGVITKNIPDGGQIRETRGDSKSYTARAQLNFDRTFGSDHQVTALAGAERRAVNVTSTTLQRFGYNDNNLQFLPVDALLISNLTGTESIESTFNYRYNDNNFFTNTEDRYVSFYGNAGYTFKRKYNLTGSVRVDDSNLFGTDPKYRHIPLWSAGAGWRISQESFMYGLDWLNNLNLRVTYGMGGNIAKQVGPYLQASSAYFYETEGIATTILYPPNRSLRWERTATTNLGIDFGIIRNRISGSFDFYSRKTTDLLGEKRTDPTNAFNTALINYGSLTNKGFEVAVNTVNIDGAFKWNTRIAFSHNKNKMTEISPTSESIYAFVDGFGAQRVGYPMNSLFNFRSAGLDPTNGTPLVYDKDGKPVANYDQNGSIVANMTDVDALVYAGTMTPTYTAGLTNTFAYKGFTLNVMVIANGGNVMRDAIPQILSSSNFSRNQDRRVLNYWKKPGDEKIPGVMPAPDLRNTGGTYLSYIWYSTDVNTVKADYIKVRDIALSYDFASALKRFTRLSSARLLVQVQNAYSWFRNNRDLDPEAYQVNSIGAERSLPVMPTYMVGLDLTF